MIDDTTAGNLSSKVAIEPENHTNGNEKSANQKPVLETNCEKLKRIYERLDCIAQTNVPVILSGESGTGKEILAQQIHHKSPRSSQSMVAMNCGALPRDIVGSHLFGHEKGAFTGATKKKRGYFEIADGSTLFLDEIGEMSPDVQVKLLRVLEYGTFRRVGGEENISVDTRIIAATNKDIETAVEEGQFRKDLYFRLRVIHLTLPPLRERKSDIPQLTRHFLSKYNSKYEKSIEGIRDEYMQKLFEYNWPGNIRELKNTIERSVILSKGSQLNIDTLPSFLSDGDLEQETSSANGQNKVTIPVGTSIEEAESEIIQKTLESVDYNISETARILGYSRATLYKKMNNFNLASE